MARTRPSLDPLFEFDAPQTFTDLSAPLSPLPAGEHDAWFDRVHVAHSKPSAELARELQEKLQGPPDQQLKDPGHTKLKSTKKWSVGKENHGPDWREIGNKQLKQQSKTNLSSLKEMRAAHEPFQVHKGTTEGKKVLESHKKSRKPLTERRDAGNRQETGRKRENKELKSLEALLARHNKKFKAVHTYEPPQHSVREVKQWERETKKSYYALSAEERVQANQEIAVWKKQRQEGTTH